MYLKRIHIWSKGIYLMMFALSAASCTETHFKPIDLAGEWKFSIANQASFADSELDDTDWEIIQVPSSWESEGFKGYNGFAWYRKTFELGNFNQDLQLNLGRIDDSDEVYLNGHLIGRSGSLPPYYGSAYMLVRHYRLPFDLLNTNGKNVIAVKVYDNNGLGGILGSEVSITKHDPKETTLISLTGEWKFRTGDSAVWSHPNIKDSLWTSIGVPSYWEEYGFKEYDGFAWYRKSFELIDRLTEKEFTLIMGKVDDMDETFVNGTLVGSTGEVEKKWGRNNEYRKFRIYDIPNGLLRSDTLNVLAVRVYDQYAGGGIYHGPLVIVPKSQKTDFWEEIKHENRHASDWFHWLLKLISEIIGEDN